jgi:hypothetical protein
MRDNEELTTLAPKWSPFIFTLALRFIFQFKDERHKAREQYFLKMQLCISYANVRANIYRCIKHTMSCQEQLQVCEMTYVYTSPASLSDKDTQEISWLNDYCISCVQLLSYAKAKLA